MTRLEANKMILKKIEEFMEANPDLRFFQALFALGIVETERGTIVDKFNEESVFTLSKM